MNLSFLPEGIREGLSHLNSNFLTEIRLRKGSPVIVEYMGEYRFLTIFGISDGNGELVVADDVASVLNAATDGCIYNYAEQLKNGFITVGHGIRIGVAGEYVTENGRVIAIKNITSLNVRIPHDIAGCANELCRKLFLNGAKNTLIYSAPGLGKTTMLRDIARFFGKNPANNVLILDERGEIAANDAYGNGYILGCGVDVVRCYSKLSALKSAIRAMKPQIILTDELYGEDDLAAVKYAVDCGIALIASSHVTVEQELLKMPFEYFVKLNSIGGPLEIYVKDSYSRGVGCVDHFARLFCIGEQEKTEGSVQ